MLLPSQSPEPRRAPGATSGVPMFLRVSLGYHKCPGRHIPFLHQFIFSPFHIQLRPFTPLDLHRLLVWNVAVRLGITLIPIPWSMLYPCHVVLSPPILEGYSLDRPHLLDLAMLIDHPHFSTPPPHPDKNAISPPALQLRHLVRLLLLPKHLLPKLQSNYRRLLPPCPLVCRLPILSDFESI